MGEEAMKLMLPHIVRKLKFDFDAVAEQLSAQFHTQVDVNWCRMAFAELHSNTSNRPGPVLKVQPMSPLPPPPASRTASTAPVQHMEMRRSNGEQHIHTKPMNETQALPGEEDSHWSFSQWAEDQRAAEQKMKQHRTVLFEKVLASMGGISRDGQNVNIPYEVQTAIQDRRMREGMKEQTMQEEKQQQWLHDQRAALRNRFKPDSIDSEGIHPVLDQHSMNTHVDSDEEEFQVHPEHLSTASLGAHMTLNQILEDMNLDLDTVLAEVEATLPLDDEKDGESASELGEVLQYLEQAAQQSVNRPTTAASTARKSVPASNMTDAQHSQEPDTTPHKRDKGKQAGNINATNTTDVDRQAVAGPYLASATSTDGGQRVNTTILRAPVTKRMSPNKEKSASGEDDVNRHPSLPGICDEVSHALHASRNSGGDKMGASLAASIVQRAESDAAADAADADDADDADDDDDGEESIEWQRQRMKAAAQALASSQTDAIPTQHSNQAADNVQHQKLEDTQRVHAGRDAVPQENLEQTSIITTPEPTDQVMSAEVAMVQAETVIAAITTATSTAVSDTVVPLASDITGSLFEPSSNETQKKYETHGTHETHETQAVKRADRMRRSIELAKERRRLLALTQQQQSSEYTAKS